MKLADGLGPCNERPGVDGVGVEARDTANRSFLRKPLRAATLPGYAVSNIQNHFRDPAPILVPQAQSVVRRRLDLVVEHVPAAVDRLAADRCLEPAARRVERDVEPGVEPMLGLAAKDQLVEPIDQQVSAISAASETDSVSTTWTSSRLATITSKSPSPAVRNRSARSAAEDPEPQVGGVLKRFGCGPWMCLAAR